MSEPGQPQHLRHLQQPHRPPEQTHHHHAAEEPEVIEGTSVAPMSGPLSARQVRQLQRTRGNRAVGLILQRQAASTPATVQRYREFDKVAGTRDYANGGKGIDGADGTYHYSMNPRPPVSPVADHFNEVHVTFDEYDDEELAWDSRPHFYFKDILPVKYVPKENTGANVAFRRDHEEGDDKGWAAFEALKKRAQGLAAGLIPKLPEYEGESVADVKKFHEARLQAEQEAAATKKAEEEAVAAEAAELAAAEKADKKTLRVTFDAAKLKNAQVATYGEKLMAASGALASTGKKAQGARATLCTVTLGFASFKAAQAAIPKVEAAAGRELTISFA